MRERKEDIAPLTNHILSMFAQEMDREGATLSAESLKALEGYHFPGNIRDLRKIIRSALIRSDASIIQPEHLEFFDAPPQINQLPQNNEELIKALTKVRRQAAGHLVRDVLTAGLSSTDGNVAEMARRYGMDRARLYQLAREYDLDLNQLKSERK